MNAPRVEVEHDEESLHEALAAGFAIKAPTEAKGRGRPRSFVTHEAILVATLDLLAENGFERLTIEAVAARAGVGKATVYRRWSSKLDLVLEVLDTVASAAPAPDTGTTRDDLLLFVGNIVRGIGHAQYGKILTGLAAELSRNAPMAEAFRDKFLRPRRVAAYEIINRGIERGDIRDDVDIEMVLDLLVAPLYYRRIVSGMPINPDLTEKIVDHALRGIAAPGDPALDR